ncbi:NAD(P)/FAD-dependent oxidoreductase [Flavobacterium sp. AG291]|uniref:NAD(P)/FAD-dependent oxidoreductase n=1 Tax=Flavobacterium sp. AG291 TaxID=2184000 RepID=UPI000E0A7B75|nr:FAD-dependent oxidoreductase [Flavobacterium sp. AG291]RDI15994.1 glycine/D-amino acid oxidase-like deaminating enzyme [Flavobacterium sp. AG291]
MKDFIIVGAGLAGVSFAETALLNDKSFVVISDNSQNSSYVAAGLYNPVILKRFSLPQDAAVHLDYMGPFYKRIEERLGVKFDISLPVYRKFASVEEQNNWFQAADKAALEPFLSPKVLYTDYEGLPAEFGFGKVMHTGYVDTETLLNTYKKFLSDNVWLVQETFQHDLLEIKEDHVVYKGIEAQHIIFAEGFGIHANPYFKHLPLDGTKGELLLIKALDLKLDVAVNASIFILPIGDGFFKVGATYEWYDKTAVPTQAGRDELVEKLNELINCDYEIIEHLAGIRPTVKDRKPLIGTHPLYKNVHLLNGLGTRGVMLGPSMAKELYDSIITGNPVRREVGIQRFKNL